MRCKKCGHCCSHLIIEVDLDDVIREPRIMAVAKPLKNLPEEREEYGTYSGKFLLTGGASMCCPFLTIENHCAIYKTRPDICRTFDPGSEQCKLAARRRKDEA